jgi:hypothetical protein
MKDEPNTVSCLEFQEQLMELFHSGADAKSHPHLRTCDLCRALVYDLEIIAEEARRRFPGNGM